MSIVVDYSLMFASTISPALSCGIDGSWCALSQCACIMSVRIPSLSGWNQTTRRPGQVTSYRSRVAEARDLDVFDAKVSFGPILSCTQMHGHVENP